MQSGALPASVASLATTVTGTIVAWDTDHVRAQTLAGDVPFEVDGALDDCHRGQAATSP